MSRPEACLEDSNVTYMLVLNCALKLVEEIILQTRILPSWCTHIATKYRAYI